MEQIKSQLKNALCEFFNAAKLNKGDIFVVGCSTSELIGNKIGTSGSEDCAKAVFQIIYDECKKRELFLAAQCCEHLNRAIVIEKECFDSYRMTNRVNVVPHRKAGGSFATAAYNGFSQPFVVESIKAHAGIDIGDTFIGMHLLPVAVPVRVSVNTIGGAHLTLARTRYKYIGGERAVYDDSLS